MGFSAHFLHDAQAEVSLGGLHPDDLSYLPVFVVGDVVVLLLDLPFLL